MEEKKKRISLAGILHALRENVPLPALVLLALSLVAAVVHLLSVIFPAFADAINQHVAAGVRFALAKVSGVLPFSFAEMVIIALPALLIITFVCIFVFVKTKRDFWRFFSSLLAVLGTLYALFVFTLGCGYHGATLDAQLGHPRENVSAQDLYDTAVILRAETDLLAAEFPRAKGASVMPYAVDGLNERLLRAYDTLSEDYGFIQNMSTRIKSVSLSDAKSYTHITGVYTYMTGEANLNVALPDYTLPFTAAHELAHQRGIARENEANFIAFLVCIASDDPYIRYSGYFNMLEYVASALYRADRDLYTELVKGYSDEVKQEMVAYREFYQKYQDSVVGEISGAVNDAYLQLQGTQGTRSYGMVVDLAVAYYKQRPE